MKELILWHYKKDGEYYESGELYLTLEEVKGRISTKTRQGFYDGPNARYKIKCCDEYFEFPPTTEDSVIYTWVYERMLNKQRREKLEAI
jgi:hypothetical protein